MTPEEFPAWLANVLRSAATHSVAAVPVEDYQRWADTVSAEDRPPADASLRTVLEAAFKARLDNKSPLTDPEIAAALITGIAFAAADVIPTKFLNDCRDGNLMVGLATALNRFVAAGAADTASGRARLVWLLRGLRHNHDGVEPLLSPAARESLAGVAAIAMGLPVPVPAGGDTAFLKYLREQSVQPVTSPPPRPRLRERVRRFFGGDRYEWTRTGVARLGVLALLLVATSVGGYAFFSARQTLVDFRMQNGLSLYEKSLLHR